VRSLTPHILIARVILSAAMRTAFSSEDFGEMPGPHVWNPAWGSADIGNDKLNRT